MEICVGATLLKSANTDSATESALVDRCKRQDMEAFGKLVDAYQHRVYGYVKRMLRDSEEASDVAQEVFIKAFQAFARFDGRSSLRTWLFRIAHNLCIDRARRSDRAPSEMHLDQNTDDEQAFEIADSRWDPQSLLIDRELAIQVESAVGSMSDKLRSVLLLHDREDMAYEEIAQTLSLPVGTVKSRLFLARSHLQQVLGPYLKGEATS